MTTLHGSAPSLRRRVEGCVPSEGSMLSQFGFTILGRVERRLIARISDETPHDSLPPPPLPPVAPPAVVQTTIIDDVHTYGPYRAACETVHEHWLPSHSPPTLQHNVSRRELEVLRQRSDESVSSFISRWHGKIAEIIDRPSEKDQIQMVLRSLQPRIARHVVETYDQAYMPTLVLPYFATQGTERPHALRKLTKAKLLMALIPKSLPHRPSRFKMDLYYAAQTSFVLILDVEKVQTPYVDDVHIPDVQNVIRGSRVRCIDSSPEPDQSQNYHHSEGLSHMVTVGKAIYIVFSNDDLPPEDNGSALNVYHLATTIALDYAPSDFGPSTLTTMVLDMMRSMSYLLGMGLGTRIVREAGLQRLIHWLQLSDGAQAPTSALMTLYFRDEIDEHEIFSNRRHNGWKDVIVVADLFDGHVGPVEGASDFVNLPFSFDVLSGFISRSDDVHDFSFMDLSVFEYLLIFYDITLFVHSSPTSQILDIDDDIARHDSDDDSSSASDLDPIDQRVSPATEHTKVVDFSTADQPSELKIRLDLSTDESDCLIQLLKSYLNIFAWSYEDMPDLNPSIVQHHLPLLPHARLVKQKLRLLHSRWSL
ncbi:hypothetical protein AAG906_020859 [Vitis piasezkii]